MRADRLNDDNGFFAHFYFCIHKNFRLNLKRIWLFLPPQEAECTYSHPVHLLLCKLDEQHSLDIKRA